MAPAEVHWRSLGVPGLLHPSSGMLPAGARVAVVGPSGCGKTLFLRALAGRQRGASGCVAPAADAVDLCPQAAPWADGARVGETVEFHAKCRAQPAAAARRVLANVGLGRCSGRQVGALSGGQSTRLRVACALLGGGSVVLLDEPLSGLDAPTAEGLLDTVAALSGTTVVLSLHQPSQRIWARFDHVVMLAAGHVVMHGPPELCVAVARRGLARCAVGGLSDAEAVAAFLGGWEPGAGGVHPAELAGTSLPPAPPRPARARAGWCAQTGALLARGERAYRRENFLPRVGAALALGVLTALVCARATEWDFGGVVGYVVMLQAVFPLVSLGALLRHRDVFRAERAAGLYAPSAHFAAHVVLELFYSAAAVAALVLPVWAALQPAPLPDLLSFCLGVHLFSNFVTQTAGHALGGFQACFNASVMLASLNLLGSGIVVPVRSIPWALGWVATTSPARIAYDCLDFGSCVHWEMGVAVALAALGCLAAAVRF